MPWGQKTQKRSKIILLYIHSVRKHSLYGTVKFTATYLKCVSLLDFSLRAAWAGHWLLGRPKQLWGKNLAMRHNNKFSDNKQMSHIRCVCKLHQSEIPNALPDIFIHYWCPLESWCTHMTDPGSVCWHWFEHLKHKMSHCSSFKLHVSSSTWETSVYYYPLLVL